LWGEHQMESWSVARKTLVGFASTLLLTMAIIIAGYWMTASFQHSSDRIRQSVEGTAASERVNVALVDILSHQGRYLTGRNEAELQAREAAKIRLRETAAALGASTYLSAQTLANRVNDEVTEEIAVLDDLLREYQALGASGVLPVDVRDRWRPLSDQIRADLQELGAVERREIAATQAADRRTANLLYGTLAAIAAVCIVGMGWLLAHILRELESREKIAGQLSDTNAFLESLLDNIPAMVFVKDAQDLRFVRINRAGELLLGIQREELLGKSDRDFFPKEQAQYFVNKDREALQQGVTLDVPAEEIDTRTGGKRILHTRKIPVQGEAGKVRLMLGISMDITEQKKAEEEVLNLNVELKHNAELLAAANQDLEGFCYSISHDLRSPLRAIDGFARLLEEDLGPAASSEAQRHLRTIRSNTERMARLIDDLLEFSRLGRQPLTAASVDMTALARKVVEEVSNAREALPQIEVQALPTASGDAAALHHVWLNLLDNAVKYSSTSEAPHIVVSGEKRPDEVIYSVRDNGVGFDMRYYDKLFGVFQRLHSNPEFPGTGVGLAIVQRIVARHGGRVWAQSSPGMGAAFSFSLPGSSTTVPAEHVA
jgi:PAS domain S-box-containing protein